ncbi:MAG: O-antigen polysaccharide polymerase Wzy [Marinilabiliaceae bacterium]|nr:O-antigen polysaccharide polymerase Wzy [Marinilabiliaceae bacterium]
MAFYLIKAYKSTDRAMLWSPMSFISMTYFYYCVIGPLLAIQSGETDLRMIEHRPYMATAWQGAAISYLMIYIGYSTANFRRFKYYPHLDQSKSQKEAIIVFIGTLALMIATTGFGFITRVNFLDNAGDVSYSGTFSQYLFQAVIFFATPVLLSIKPMIENRKIGYFVLFAAFAAGLYITDAFRWRLVFLMIASMSTYHLLSQKKINIKLIAIVILPFLALMGALEVARSYGRGINTQTVSQYKTNELIDNSFNESAVFMATGYLMEKYEDKLPFTHLAFIENAIAMPIPRALWPGKPAGEYLLGVNEKLYGKHGKGQAYLNFGEYYVAWGWFGIVIFNFIIGIIIKYWWQRYLANRNNYIGILTISIINAMMYVLISRGYLAQFVTLIIFALIPLEIVKYRIRKTEANTNVRTS